MSVGILRRNQAESWPFGTCSATEGKAARSPSFCEVEGRFRNSRVWCTSSQTARKGAKSSRSPNARVGNALSPLSTARKQLFLSQHIPKPEVGGGGPEPCARGKPRGRTCSFAAGKRGSFLDARSPESSHSASPSFGRLGLPPASATSARTAAIRGGRDALTLWAVPSWWQGSTVWGGQERRSKLPTAAGLPESRAPPPPPRLAAESTAEKPARAGGEGALQADGAGPAGPGSTPTLRPGNSDSRRPSTPGLGLSKQKGRRKGKDRPIQEGI